MRKRQVFVSRIALALLLASLLFVALFFIAYGFSYWAFQNLSHQTNSLRTSVNELDVILSDFKCDDDLLIESSELFDSAADRLTLLENRFGKRDSRVLEQKIIYSELEALHFDIVKRFNKECNGSYITVLFFYSNSNGKLEAMSEAMGFVLTTFEHQNSDKIMVYSFDRDLDSTVVSSLIENYKITEIPSVVVNEGEPFTPKRFVDMLSYL